MRPDGGLSASSPTSTFPAPMAPSTPDGETEARAGLAILEAESLLRGLLTFAFQSAGHRVLQSGSHPGPFFQAMAHAPPRLVILGWVASPLDSSEDGMPPLQLLAWQRAVCPAVPALLLVRDLSDASAARLRDAGAKAVLDPCRAELPHLLGAVREALAPAGSNRALPVSGRRESVAATLTPREREVLRMVGEGASNTDIAAHLSITERTVRAHIGNLYRKLGVDSRARMALSARALEPQQTSAELDRLPFLDR